MTYQPKGYTRGHKVPEPELQKAQQETLHDLRLEELEKLRAKEAAACATQTLYGLQGKHIFSSGASRSAAKLPYHFIPFEGMQRLAARCKLGAEIYGAYNWQKGGQDFVQDAINHMYEHLLFFMHGIDPIDDHLAAIAWGAFALMWYQENRPEDMPFPPHRPLADHP